MKPIYYLLIVIVFIIIVVIRYSGKARRFPWYEFYSRGRREGFSFKEIRFLKKIAIQNRLEKPQSIFWSTKQLDRCLRPAIKRIEADENMDDVEKLAMITKLLELRKKAEFNLPKYKKRIRDTHALIPRQKLVVRDKEYGTFLSWVIEVNRKYLVISQPMGHPGWKSLNWRGHKINIYFWRIDDAGYSFTSKVLEQIVHEEYPLLYIAHSNKLERTQKRKSIRVETSIRVKFYPVSYSTSEKGSKPFISKRGHIGKIIDLSESGCCMIAGKGMKKNQRLKIDFFLTDEKRIITLGVIVNISKTSDERVKKYHIMFIRLSSIARNNILLYVFNIFGEREEEKKEKSRLTLNKPSPNITTTSK